MYKNMGKLVTPNTNQEFAEFHLYKLIAIVFVISGHRQMYAIGQTPLYNVDWVEQVGTVSHSIGSRCSNTTKCYIILGV